MPLNVSTGASPVSMPARMVLLTGPTLVAVGCAGEANVTASKSPATSTPPLAIRTATPYVRPGLVPARVTRVVDGDTIHVELGGLPIAVHRHRYARNRRPEAPGGVLRRRGERAEPPARRREDGWARKGRIGDRFIRAAAALCLGRGPNGQRGTGRRRLRARGNLSAGCSLFRRVRVAASPSSRGKARSVGCSLQWFAVSTLAPYFCKACYTLGIMR